MVLHTSSTPLRTSWITCIVLALLLLQQAVFAQQVTVTHAQGETTVTVNPTVVYSFDYASIDTLQYFGIEVDGLPPLANASYAYGKPDAVTIGSLFEPDYELIAAEQPDLIIVSGRSSAAYAQLSAIAPTIDLTFTYEDFVGDLSNNIRILAQIFDLVEEGEEAIAAIEQRVEDLTRVIAANGNGLVAISLGTNVSVLTPGPGATAGRGRLLYQALGMVPAIEDTSAIQGAVHGDPVSFEFFLQYDPDWIFVIDRDAAVGGEDGQPAAIILDNEIIHQTTAWQQEQIVYLDPFDWYIITGAGIQSMHRMLDEIAAAYAR